MSSSFTPKLHHPQVSEASRLGSPWARRHHPLAVCREAYLRTAEARHGNGRPLSHVVGAHEHPEWETMQGPTLALLLCLGGKVLSRWGWVGCFIKAHGIPKEVEE